MPPNIYDFVRTARDNYEQDTITIVDGYEWSQYDTLRKIELYSNSRYVNGQIDEFERTKPFYNIVNRLVTLSDTAEDIDRKDITISTDDPEAYIKSFMFTKENQNWMKTSGFGQTLNDMTHTRGKYGGVLVKKVETDDELDISVVDWRNVVTDQTNINGIKIEKAFYTPSELLEEGGERGWDRDKMIEAIQHAETNQDDNDDGSESFEQRKTPTPYIEVWEAHGVFPKSYAATDEEIAKAEEEDRDLDYEFEDRVFILSNLDKMLKPESNGVGEAKDEYEDDCILFTEVEGESLYKYLPYEKVPGRALGVGRIEKAFEAQMWTNDVILKQKDVIDIAFKTIVVTDDPKAGRNVMKDKRTGDVIKLQQGRQMQQLNLTPAALSHVQGLLEQWNTQVERASSTFAANTGEQLPAGTPYRLGSMLNEEANSTFIDRRDEMGIFLEEIYTDWVIPFLKKRLSNKHVLTSEFDLDELKLIDESFIAFEVKERFLDKVFETGSVQDAEQALPEFQQEARERVQQTKNKRFLDIPEGYYDDVEFKLSVNVTNEKRMKAVFLETLSNILTTVSQSYDPNTGKFRLLEDPKLSRLFNQIMETAGFSPIEMQLDPGPQSPPVQTQPQTAQAPEVPQPAGGGLPAPGFTAPADAAVPVPSQ